MTSPIKLVAKAGVEKAKSPAKRVGRSMRGSLIWPSLSSNPSSIFGYLHARNAASSILTRRSRVSRLLDASDCATPVHRLKKKPAAARRRYSRIVKLTERRAEEGDFSKR